jgi:hypothetical protein
MDVLTLQAPVLENNENNCKPAGTYGYRPTCPHAHAEVVMHSIHPGSIFSESGPDWDEMLFCPDCHQAIYPAAQAQDPRDRVTADEVIQF